MLLTLSGRSFIKIQYSSFPLFPVAYPFRIATNYNNVNREKCIVNDVIFPSGCEARAINLGSKNMKNGIFTGGTSVRSKNIFTDISRYPTGKHKIKESHFCISDLLENWYIKTVHMNQGSVTDLEEEVVPKLFM